METTQLTNDLTAAAAADLNQRLKDGTAALDWSGVTHLSDDVLTALLAGFGAEAADDLGVDTMSDAIATVVSEHLEASGEPRRPRDAPTKHVAAPCTSPDVWRPKKSERPPSASQDVTAPRRHLCRALHADLIGPYHLDEEAIAEQELLELPPSRTYLTGFLASEHDSEPDDVDKDDELDAGSDRTEEETQNVGRETPKRKSFWPASVGMSLLIPGASKTVTVTVAYNDYVVEPTKVGKRQPANFWRRQPRRVATLKVDLPSDEAKFEVPVPESRGLVIVGRLQDVHEAHGMPAGSRALAIFLTNRRPPGEKGRRDEGKVFQVQLEVECPEGILPRPNQAGERSDDWDERVADLQFRERFEYAVGHAIAVEVPGGQEPVTRVQTTWLPTYEVRRVVPHSEAGVTVSMEDLGQLTDAADVTAKLARLPQAYGQWIEEQLARDVGHGRRAETRDALMKKAALARDRMADGLKLLQEDAQLRRAFCLANQAMAQAARQRSPSRYQGDRRPEWRLFQLAFVLLNLRGVSDGHHVDRERVELIFFPTGGGKTEAYLGTVAFALVLRRLRRAKLPDGGLGVAILLRYTLRLLTLDQLGRAATLICALETLRRQAPAELGDGRFSVGLWVGASATANTMKVVKKEVLEFKSGIRSSPCPLPDCPWCRTPLGPSSLSLMPSKKEAREVVVACTNEKCPFCAANHPEGLPLVFVDEQVYRELPSFLIATVDKFAMMPWRGEAGGLFGKVSHREGRVFFGPLDKPPKGARALPGGLAPLDLIIQDELHLISGPLGTMVGLYETAIDALASRTDGEQTVRPKVLAATATVRRADAQIQALYGRSADLVSVFPPPAVDDSETYFATVDRVSPGRLYLGVAAQGRSMKAILLRVYRTLLAGAMHQYDPAGDPAQTADCYMTLAGYFNSLRELGGMRRLVEADVMLRAKEAESTAPRSEATKHLWFKNRDIKEPAELTSRESTGKVKTTKDRLSQPFQGDSPVDVLLASNMISVGVDIDRLGLMVVAGQPKTTAEYIQASSRVGRQERWPGLVVTAYNVHKSRDRSHYEHFGAYHESFYRYVEATSVTPFSGPALERGLVGTLAAMTRFGAPELTPPKGAMRLREYREIANQAVKRIAARASTQPDLTQTAQMKLQANIEERGMNLLDTWSDLVTSTDDSPKQRHYSRFDLEKPAGKPLLFLALDEGRPPDGTPDAKFSAPTSMRDVESTAHLWVVGRSFGGRR